MGPIQTVSLSFYRFDSFASRLWALTQMGVARFTLPKTPGIGFWKLCGSGTGEGFTPVPNMGVYAILATWDSLADAQAQTQNAPTFRRYARRAAEAWTVYLSPTAARGQWSGQTPFQPQMDERPGPLAAMTRATIKPSVALQFWKHVPGIEDVIGDDPNVAFKIGIGEVPLLHQVTFSIWPNTQTMADFARCPGGAHSNAIKAVRQGDWFQEELYARFRVLGDVGSWGGASPLAHLPKELT